MTSAVLVGLGLVVPLSVSGPVRQRLVIREQAPSRRIFRSVPISDDDVVAMTWMHSVDKTPWWEYYSPVDGELVLDCTELALMGAGTPFDAPQTEIDGDKVRLCGLDEHFPAVRWIHSHRVHHRIYLDGELILPTRAIDHHVRAEMIVIGDR
ncbi:MAG TPA: DUF1850 domain-containing protein [Candidatus Brevibacterium intestinavium]|nr:DUF1850 domain-containing protein [Candidatus Brevibacterium intestinavium]